MLSDGSPHSDQWPIGDLISDSIGFANWDGQGTELTFSGCKAARLPLAQLPEEMQEVDELVRVNRAPDPFPISVGDIFGATVEKAFGASTIEWELLFQVKSITPVLGAATTE